MGGDSLVGVWHSRNLNITVLLIARNGDQNFFRHNNNNIAPNFTPVPGTNGDWLVARYYIPASQPLPSAPNWISNTHGKFLMAAAVGGPGTNGARFNYFSDFSRREVNILPDTVLACASVMLNASGSFQSYQWSTSEQTPAITVGQSGIYVVHVTDQQGCRLTDSTRVLLNSTPVIDTLTRQICPGQTFTLPSGVVVSMPGVYQDTLHYQQGCDSVIHFIHIDPAASPLQGIEKSNDISCARSTAQLTALGNAISYQWSPADALSNGGIRNPIARPTTTTTYYLTAENAAGCIAKDSITVRADFADTGGSFLLPDMFTPNGDGLNDCFGISHWLGVRNVTMLIYDRWGVEVFRSHDPQACWDGTFKGKRLTPDVFVYLITGEAACGKILKKGTISLVK